MLQKLSYFLEEVDEPQAVGLFLVEPAVVDFIEPVAEDLVCPFVVFLLSFITVKFN